MNKNFFIVTFLTTLAIVSIYLFFNYRLVSYKNIYKDYLIKSNNDIVKFTKNSFKNENITNSDVKNYLDKINNKSKSIAAIYFIENNSLAMSSKKSVLLKSDEDFEAIASDLKANELKIDLFEEIEKSSSKYHYYMTKINSFKILFLYSYKFPMKIKLKILFEIILLITVFVGSIMLLFIKQVKTPKSSKIQNDISLTENSKIDSQITDDEEIKTKIKKKVRVKNVNIDTRIINTKSFESYIYDVFKKINTNYKLSSISIYKYYKSLKTSCQLFELKDNSFFKPNKEIKGSNFKAIASELEKGSFFIKNEGRTIFIPIFSKKEFIGFLSANSQNKISVDVAKKILKIANPVADKLAEFKG